MTFEEKINLIINNYQSGSYIEAEVLARDLLEKNKDDYQLLNIYGLIQIKLKKSELAISYFKRSTKIKSDFFDAYFNLSVAFNNLRKLDEAILPLKKCLKINPQSTETLIFLGNLYLKKNQEKYSEQYYVEVLKFNSKHYIALYSLANLYKKQKKYDKAIDHYKLAIKHYDNAFASHNNLATLYQDIGEFELAISNFKSAIKINPKFSSAYQNYLFCLNFSKFYELDLYTSLVEQFRNSLPKIDISKVNQIKIENKKNKKIKVGFVSGDFGQHPVSYYLLSIINYIDKESFDLVAYSNSNRDDEITLALKKKFNYWRKINHLSDLEVINLIKEDTINILIDLSGHTAKNRLSVFINKPSPVQITWLGYNASTGLKEIDYILVDPHVVALSDQKYFSEKIFQLPNTFQCITTNNKANVDIKEFREAKEIVFGSFNNLAKINDNVIFVWSEILKKVKNSKLFLKSRQLDDPTISQKIKEKFKKNKIDENKIIIEGRSKTREEMLNKYNQIDIALDPFPYPGVTTSLEAISMGVPLITKNGNNFYSNIGKSINKNLKMDDWIATDEKDYVLKANSKTLNLEKLFQTKKELREKFLKSPLSDAEQFAKDFGNSLKIMWESYLKNNKDF